MFAVFKMYIITLLPTISAETLIIHALHNVCICCFGHVYLASILHLFWRSLYANICKLLRCILECYTINKTEEKRNIQASYKQLLSEFASPNIYTARSLPVVGRQWCVPSPLTLDRVMDSMFAEGTAGLFGLFSESYCLPSSSSLSEW